MDKTAFLGLMSGTSMDGIDAVLVSFSDHTLTLHATHTQAYPDTLRQRLTRLSQNQGSPDDLGELDHQLGCLFGEAARQVLEKSPLSAVDVAAIGSHGQTVRHQPKCKTPFSIQLGDPNIIVEATGIPTVADFRRRDIAAGGEGAPLVPAFHRAYFGQSNEDRCILNIGGIANISWLSGDNSDDASGFDTGPGNGLMDAWCLHQTGRHYDENGRWANEGRIDQNLLSDMLSDGYFAQQAPKSTGKEKFNLDWIQTMLNRHPEVRPADVQRTLLELTVITIVRQLPQSSPQLKIYACGGGVKNSVLMAELQKACLPFSVHSTQELGLDPQWVEATAFAWLAKQTLLKLPGNVPKVTGAIGNRILGAIYWP
ncbi:anhydro-N-acetylmuramic acid kinase [Marinobacter caseinilyticus]|uniref:anhydro-N-acetylmuramic acid kinase n=1 Tax=Marinobacter caseinilyticus TaxID=2692195 RepID=UPI00140DFEC2|nr:anhydro-N-acetylmuramic acid kinase [Marinobacter caseinilyticus]